MNLTVPDQTAIIEFTHSLRFKLYAIFCVTHFRPYLEPVVGDLRTSGDLVHFLDYSIEEKTCACLLNNIPMSNGFVPYFYFMLRINVTP